MIDGTTAAESRPTGGGFIPPTPEGLQAVLPGYEVDGLLGLGGMGAVYKARQIALDRIVAIKVLPNDPENDTMNFAERFQREAQAMAKFLQPRIVAVFDFGKTQFDQPHPSGLSASIDLLYIVIEYVEGTDLCKILAREFLPSSQVIHIFTQICDALHYAHDHGIIHRDIKPANIMLDVEGNVKVADFGLAKLSGDAAAAQAQLTLSGMAMGTPDYVAPEMLEMGTEPDHRVDIYALGVMLYQMLTGKIPRGLFKGPSEIMPGLDTRLEEVIEKAMQADPDHRYQTVEEFWIDLDEIRTNPKPVDPDLEDGTVAMEKQPSSRVKIKPPEGSTRDVKVEAVTHPEQTKATSKKSLLIAAGVSLVTLLGVGLFFLLNPSGSESSNGDSPGDGPQGNDIKKPSIGVPPLSKGREPIALLASIDLERDVLSGSWQKVGNGIQKSRAASKEGVPSLPEYLRIPLESVPEDAYTFHGSFTRKLGTSDATVLLPVAGTCIEVALSNVIGHDFLTPHPYSETWERIQGRRITFEKRPRIENKVPHELRIDLVPGPAEIELTVQLDGENRFSTSIKRSELKKGSSAPPTLAVGGWASIEIIWHEVRLESLGGDLNGRR